LDDEGDTLLIKQAHKELRRVGSLLKKLKQRATEPAVTAVLDLAAKSVAVHGAAIRARLRDQSTD
jgi:hypothetical protein